MRHKTVAVILIALLVGLGYLAGVQSVKADDPPASPVEVPQGWQRLGPYGGKVVDVAYAPSDPNIVYALLDNRAVPVYKSIDNGKTWNFLSVPFNMFVPQNIVVSPVDPNTVIFSDSNHIFRTSDGGLNWDQLNVSDVHSIQFSKANPNKVYGSTGNSDFLRSQDAGRTWASITDYYIQSFNVDPFHENWIYTTSKGSGNANRGFFVSEDDGQSWELRGFEKEYIRKIVMGREPGVIYLVKYYDTTIRKSTDYGVTWSTLTGPLPSYIIDLDINGSLEDEIFVTVENLGDPFNSNIWRSIDDGTTWSNVPSRWAYLLYDDISVDPSNSQHLIGFQKWFGMHYTWDSGTNWTQSGAVFPGIALDRVAISPASEDLMLVYTWGNGYVMRSIDAGQTWEYTNFRKPAYSNGGDIVFSPLHADRVFISESDCLYRSTNQGWDWEVLSVTDFYYPYSLAIHPVNDQIVLCGSKQGKIVRSNDAGDTWDIAYDAYSTDVKISEICFKLLNPSIVYAATFNWVTSEVKLIKSTDSGATWVEVSRIPTIYLRDLAVSHTEPEVIYVSDGHRLLRSKDQGSNWDLPGAYRSIDSDRCLTSFHHGSWVWSLGYIVFWFSGDYGETWRNVPLPSPYGESFGEEANMWMSDSSFFVATRYDGLWAHVEDMPPVIMMGGSNYHSDSSSLNFTAWVTDVSGTADITTVDILYEGDQTGLSLYDDGTHGDVNAGDGLFNLTIPLENSSSIMNLPYSMCAKDRSNLSSDRWPVITSE